jgi:uroporphyrinogen decarboxylase
MAFKTGPLISPAMFQRLMVPRYRRVADFLRRECGCEFQLVDCDGRINELAPLWVDAGINVLFPLEAPHTDPYAIRKALGDRVVLRGGFDKKPLIEGPAAIDREFARLKPLLDGGRFIPGVDHRVPPDVPLEHYRHYRRRKCELLGKPYREGLGS